MNEKEYQVWPTKEERVFLHDNTPVMPPEDWVFVPSGDPGLTRRLKAFGPCWVVVHRRKNRIESIGLWTKGLSVDYVRRRLETERQDPAYLRKLESARKKREEKQAAYEKEFHQAVLDFLHFAPRWKILAERMASLVTAQTIPVGSGTVARTERIPLSERAESAVIAWMRHQTTSYDMMTIAGIRGKRRAVRRQLAERSRIVLERYRRGEDILPDCPLASALGCFTA